VLKIALRRRWLRDHPEADIRLTPFGGLLVGVWLATIIAVIAASKMHPDSEIGKWLSLPEMTSLFILAAVVSLFVVGILLHTVGVMVVAPRKVRDV
jgi:hypothetical protein